MVQKKINWGNKEAVVVITDKQEKREPPIPPAEKINANEGEKKKRKSREEAKEDKSLSKKFKESGQKGSNDLKRNERQEHEFQQLNEGIEKLNYITRNGKKCNKINCCFKKRNDLLSVTVHAPTGRIS